MKHIRIAVLALVVTGAMSAVVTATAVANEGELVNKNGSKLTKNKFTGTSGKVTIETTSGLSLSCASSTAVGRMSSSTTGEETVTFAECKTSLGVKCHSEGQPQGKALISLSITLLRNRITGRILLAMTILFFTKSEDVIVCGEAKEELKGGFLTEVGEAQEGKLKTSYSYVSKQKEKGIQEPLEFENEAKVKIKETLELSGVQASQTLTEAVVYEEEARLA